MNDITREEAEKLVASIGIPPRPAVVLAVMDEKSKDEPDLTRIGEAIASDVGVAAALLKTVNSPLYGLRNPISSIKHAVSLLGLNQVATLVTSLALKTMLDTHGIERFWDQSARIALLTAWLAGRLRLDRDSAQLFGLFRDAGIPLLMRRFNDYKETLRLANEAGSRGFTQIEEERHGMNHAVVGSIVARNWALPENLRTAILRHHDVSLFSNWEERAAQQLVALSHLAGQIESLTLRQEDDSEWTRFAEPVMTCLMLSDDDVAELVEEAGSLLLESGM